jgi:hypothetical protein
MESTKNEKQFLPKITEEEIEIIVNDLSKKWPSDIEFPHNFIYIH